MLPARNLLHYRCCTAATTTSAAAAALLVIIAAAHMLLLLWSHTRSTNLNNLKPIQVHGTNSIR